MPKKTEYFRSINCTFMCRCCRCFTCRIASKCVSSIIALCNIENIPALSKEFIHCLGLVMLTSLSIWNIAVG